MAVTSVVFTRKGRVQFQGLFEHVVELEALYDPPSVNSNSFQSESISAPGVALGDFVLVSFEADLRDLNLNGHVNSNGNIDLHLTNPTAGAVNLVEAQVHIIVLRPIHNH